MNNYYGVRLVGKHMFTSMDTITGHEIVMPDFQNRETIAVSVPHNGLSKVFCEQAVKEITNHLLDKYHNGKSIFRVYNIQDERDNTSVYTSLKSTRGK